MTAGALGRTAALAAGHPRGRASFSRLDGAKTLFKGGEPAVHYERATRALVRLAGLYSLYSDMQSSPL